MSKCALTVIAASKNGVAPETACPLPNKAARFLDQGSAAEDPRHPTTYSGTEYSFCCWDMLFKEQLCTNAIWYCRIPKP